MNNLKTPKSNFICKIIAYNGKKVIVIEDLLCDFSDTNSPYMTVTNNIENVLKEIQVNNKIDLKEHIVIYKDSQGIYDGWNTNLDCFYTLKQALSEGEALLNNPFLQ